MSDREVRELASELHRYIAFCSAPLAENIARVLIRAGYRRIAADSRTDKESI